MAEDWISYRGRVCFADFQYALHVAHDAGRRYKAKYFVKGVHVPGRGWHWTVRLSGRGPRGDAVAASPQA